MLEHGGNLTAVAKEYGIPLDSWLDLSTGINPNGYPIRNIPPAIWQKLPSDNDGLVEAACHYYGCLALLPTAGSQAAIQALPSLRLPCNVAMPRTMYQEHAHAWQQHGHHISFFEGTPNEACLNQIDVLLLCNPNNPTGQLFSSEQLLLWHQILAKRGGWLVLDEAFMDVTPNNSLAAHTHLEGLFVLRSLGKFFGLAGARVGFVLAASHHLKHLQEILGPWALAGPSRFIAIQALSDVDWQARVRLKLIENSARLNEMLKLYGLNPSGQTALFQFIETPHAYAIRDKLAQQGIWTRLFIENPALRFGLPPEYGWCQLATALSTI